MVDVVSVEVNMANRVKVRGNDGKFKDKKGEHDAEEIG